MVWNVADVKLSGNTRKDLESIAAKIAEINMQLRVLSGKLKTEKDGF